MEKEVTEARLEDHPKQSKEQQGKRSPSEKSERVDNWYNKDIVPVLEIYKTTDDGDEISISFHRIKFYS